jgi:A/G-specific adenine glycosylase
MFMFVARIALPSFEEFELSMAVATPPLSHRAVRDAAPAARFSRRLVAWQRACGRHDLPWQADWRRHRDPYRVWLAEIMLQQTQVATVIPYYQRFVARLPTLTALAAATEEEVLALWSGLGYYARGRNLHACARKVVARYGGVFPREAAALTALPGIGRSTAHAIAVFCFGAHLPILDGNVKRVLCRAFGVEGFPGAPAVERRLWELATALMPQAHADVYIQAQMDLGATVCTRAKPRCGACPLADDCVARSSGRIAELPRARPRKARPERTETFLLFVHGEKVLVEARPPAGIWGGLLCPPELPAGADERAHAALLGLRAETVEELPALCHDFTHFRLWLRPLRVAATPLPHAAENGRRWLALSEIATAALPAPVRTLLEMVQTGDMRAAETASRRKTMARSNAFP